MIDFIKRLFGFSAKPVEAVPANPSAPYKVEAVVDTADIAIAQLPTPVAEKAPAKPKAPARTAAARGPAAPKAKAPAKPKAPRKPKITVAK
jgi:hypothetical protein